MRVNQREQLQLHNRNRYNYVTSHNYVVTTASHLWSDAAVWERDDVCVVYK